MRSVSMATELDHVIRSNLQDVLEIRTNLHQRILAWTLSLTLGPDADSVEALAHIDHDTHDLATVVLERLADRRELGVEPEFVDIDHLFVFEAVGPFAAVLVLCIFPLWSDALLEEVVVGFYGKV